MNKNEQVKDLTSKTFLERVKNFSTKNTNSKKHRTTTQEVDILGTTDSGIKTSNQRLYDDFSRTDKLEQNIMFYSPDYQKNLKKVKEEKKNVKDSTDIFDAIANPLQNVGLGTGDVSFTSLTNVANRGKTWQLNAIDQTMRDIPYFINGASWIAMMSVKNGIDLNSDELTTKEINKIQKKVRSITPELYELIYQGEFYGFCGGLIVIEGQETEEELAKPIDFENIKKGSFKGIKILTRLYQIIPDTTELIQMSDIVNQKYWSNANLLGKPKYYRVYINGSGSMENTNFMKVHVSRLINYRVFPLSFVESQLEMNMGVSMLERVYSDMARYETLLGQVVKMAQRSNIPVFKSQNLTMSTLNSDDQLVKMYERLKLMKVAMSNSGMISIDADEEFSFESASFQDVPSVVEMLKENLAGSIRAPYSVIAHGKANKEEEKAYYHTPQKIQDVDMTAWFNVLIPIMYKSEYGKDIGEFDFDFKSLETMTEKEKAEVLKLVVESIEKLYQNNAIDVPSMIRMFQVAQTNIGDIYQEINEIYIKYAESGKIIDSNIKNKINHDIEVAKQLNQGKQDGDGKSISGVKDPRSEEGRTKGGNPKTKEKPTPKINREKE